MMTNADLLLNNVFYCLCVKSKLKVEINVDVHILFSHSKGIFLISISVHII